MRRLVLSLLLSVALVGCKKEPPAAAESAQKAAEPAASAAKPGAPDKPEGTAKGSGGQAANPLQAMAQLAKASEEMGKAMGQKNMGAIVNWRQLEPFAPEKLGEFTAEGELDGSTGGMGAMQVSQVKRRYKAGERKLRLEVTDTSLTPMLRAGFAMASKIHEDSTKGIKKGVEVGGNPGLLEWRKSRQRAKLAVLVGGRFLVQLRLRPADSPDLLMDLIKQIDVGKLAALKAEK